MYNKLCYNKNGKSKSHWISKKKTVTAPWISKRKTGPVTVKKGGKRRKRKVKKPLGLDPFQQANFAKHYRHNFVDSKGMIMHSSYLKKVVLIESDSYGTGYFLL